MVIPSRIPLLKVISNVKYMPRTIATSHINRDATDPIQKLFVEKIREYRSKSGGGKELVDATPDIKKELKTELEKLQKAHGATAGADMTQFPTFSFKDEPLDPIDEKVEAPKGQAKK